MIEKLVMSRKLPGTYVAKDPPPPLWGVLAPREVGIEVKKRVINRINLMLYKGRDLQGFYVESLIEATFKAINDAMYINDEINEVLTRIYAIYNDEDNGGIYKEYLDATCKLKKGNRVLRDLAPRLSARLSHKRISNAAVISLLKYYNAKVDRSVVKKKKKAS